MIMEKYEEYKEIRRQKGGFIKNCLALQFEHLRLLYETDPRKMDAEANEIAFVAGEIFDSVQGHFYYFFED